jgi:hypothetical protein
VGHVLVDATGRVACVKVLRGAPYGLAESYQSSFYDWRFQPAHLDGEPVAAWYWTTIRFRREMR